MQKTKQNSNAIGNFFYRIQFISILFFSLVIVNEKAFSQTSYTFTCAGATGETGPTQAQVNTAYASTNLSGSVTINAFQGIQEFNIPAGTYSVETWGAGVNGGLGAKLGGTFNFTAGQKLYIAVGQKANASAGGNGGTFVSTGTSVATSTPLLVAGGGGGNGGATGILQNNATYTTSGNPGDVGFGGTNGFGGQCNTNNTTYGGGGGGGFYGNGTNTSSYSTPGYGFVNGAGGGPIGNFANTTGGFGGGGSANTGLEPGGGGGYSGGGGGGYSGSSSTGVGGGNRFGGGGGCYNSGITQYTLGINNTGNGQVVITAVSGAALNFDGADDYVVVSSNPSLDNLGIAATTLEAWVNIGNNGVNSIIRKSGDYNLYINNNILSAEIWQGGMGTGNFTVISGSSTIPNNVWTHVAFTWDNTSSTGKLYVNGVAETTSSNGNSTGAIDPLWLGGSTTFSQFFTGSMDEVRIWKRALCAQEINNNMNGELSPPSRTGLIAYYKFNQGYSNSDNTAITTLTDATGNYTGTLNNFALTGATSNFITPGAVTTGSMVTAFTNSLSAVATATNVACNSGATGTASVTASGYTPYTYNWSSGGGTGSAQGSLTAGTYTCTIGNRCGTITQTVTITEPTQLMASSTSGTIACNSGATTVTVSATGGTPTYSNTGTYTVTAGPHTYTVTDANSCSATTTITVTEPTQLIVTATPGTIACNGGATTVTVSATGGTPTYSNTGTFSVTANSYTYTVTDANSCSATTTITVSEPTQLMASSTSGTIACNGGATTVTVLATGGTPTYSNTGTFSVTANSYTYTVMDANSCTATTTITVTEPTQLMASSTSGTIACNGGATTVTVSATGGAPTYSNTGTFSVTANSYTYTVIDANSCTATTTITVSEPTQLIVTATPGVIACNGGVTTITVSATGGTPTYSNTGTFTTMPANTYTYVITDANSCTATTTITVTEPTQLMASSTSGTVACNGGATTVTVSATGGTPTYSNTGTYTVTANSYTYTVTDANACTSTTTITVTEPTQLMASSTSGTIACNGGATTVTVSATGGTPTYSNTGTFSVTANSYTYTVTDANACTSTTTITVTQPNPVNASVTVNSSTITATNASATYQWVNCGTGNSPIAGATHQSFTPVANGSYAVEVTQGGCTATSTCTTISNIGIEKYDATNSLQVYPNPFTSELTIVSTAKTNAILFDMLGNKINEYPLQNTAQTISLGDLAPGMYYLQVDNSKIKIIKQ